MKIISASSLSFYEFECDSTLTDRILSQVIQLPWVQNKSNLTTFEDNFYDEELILWFEKCINEAKKDIGLNSEMQLPITICWANKTTKLQAHHEHTHPNSFLSGVFYLTSHNDSPTVFTFPNYWTKDFPTIDFEKSKKTNSFQVLPKKSTLILFPSYVKHSVQGHRDKETRYSISFNTFFSGSIYKDPSTKQRLELSVKTIRDLSNETKIR